MEQPKPNRWRRRLTAATGIVLTTSFLAIGFWPVLAESYAEKKARSVLERKFDVVDFGCFELSYDQVHLCELHLEKNSTSIDLEDLIVKFQVNWGDQQVLVSSIASQGGQLAGQVEDLELLRSPSKKPSSPAGAQRLVLEEAELELHDFQLDLQHQDVELQATITASSPSPAGPIDLELQDVELATRGARARASLINVERLELEKKFPLDLEVEGGEASYRDVVIKDVGGALRLEDKKLNNFVVDLHGLTKDGQTWGLKGSVDRSSASVDVVLDVEDIRPSQLPGADSLPLHPDKGDLTGSLAIKGTKKKLQVEAGVFVEGVHLEHPKLARHPIVINNVFEMKGLVNLDTRELILERATIQPLSDRGSWELVVTGRARHAKVYEEREYELEAKLESAPCQELLEAVPAGLAPALKGFELAGDTSVDFKLVMHMGDPDASVIEGGLHLDTCKIIKMPKTVAALSGPFSHLVKMKSGQTISRLLGRGALYYTPWERIPPSVYGAVLSTEDGGFWRHDGFLKSQITASLKRNIELGTFRRGASTISMQMAKNLLLSHEKTVSRKLQELFLTWVLERNLGKQRIMEIYLNIVEFGPGIYGIGDAADHYFGKAPLELTSLESAFLATLLPRPVERHEMWCRNELTPKHLKYIHVVHRRMKSFQRITPEEFDEALATPFEFSRIGWTSEKACVAAGRRVKDGKHTQGALSGLLWGRKD